MKCTRNASILDHKYFPEMIPIDNEFDAARTETTFWQYNIYAKSTNQKLPSTNWKIEGNHPVVGVSWYDAIFYCLWLTEQKGRNKSDLAYVFKKDKGAIESSVRDAWDVSLGGIVTFLTQKPVLEYKPNSLGYRLPLEIEWKKMAGKLLDIDGVAWYSRTTTEPAGSKEKNRYKLFDIYGNAQEWCNFDGKIYKERSLSGNTQELKLYGGSWKSTAKQLNSGKPNKAAPYSTSNTNGFRVVRSK